MELKRIIRWVLDIVLLYLAISLVFTAYIYRSKAGFVSDWLPSRFSQYVSDLAYVEGNCLKVNCTECMDIYFRSQPPSKDVEIVFRRLKEVYGLHVGFNYLSGLPQAVSGCGNMYFDRDGDALIVDGQKILTGEKKEGQIMQGIGFDDDNWWNPWILRKSYFSLENRGALSCVDMYIEYDELFSGREEELNNMDFSSGGYDFLFVDGDCRSDTSFNSTLLIIFAILLIPRLYIIYRSKSKNSLGG